MKIYNFPIYAYRAFHNRHVFDSKTRYLLLFSHMRSYTTLIGHILGNHSEIAGYGELHRSYRKPIDLIRLKYNVVKLMGQVSPSKTIYFDKLLHNELSVSEKIFSRQDVKSIFVIRKPVETINSIIKMGEKPDSIDWFSNANAVVNYYVERLDGLSSQCKDLKVKLGIHGLYFRAEQIIDETDQLLDSLSTKLNLGYKLDPTYETFKETGKKGVGDRSAYISTGKIVRDRVLSNNSDIPQDLISKAEKAYQDCLQTFKQYGEAVLDE